VCVCVRVRVRVHVRACVCVCVVWSQDDHLTHKYICHLSPGVYYGTAGGEKLSGDWLIWIRLENVAMGVLCGV